MPNKTTHIHDKTTDESLVVYTEIVSFLPIPQKGWVLGILSYPGHRCCWIHFVPTAPCLVKG